MTLYLKNATYIDHGALSFTTCHLAVAPGPSGGIQFVKQLPADDALGADDEMIDCSGRLVTRSFGCGHHHIYSALARGMPAPAKSPSNFVEILKYIWWHLDKRLDNEIVEASALVSALYCAKNGTTFVIDHHASPGAVKGSLATIARAFERVGLSHLLCYELSDRDGRLARDQGLAETRDYLASGRQGLVGLHASFTVGDTLLESAVALAETHGTGLHVHVAEDPADQHDCRQRYGQRVVERFQQAGVLDLPATILSHCIHLNEAEKALVRRSAAWCVQNVESNQNNNVGLADYSTLGGRVMLGTDGMHSDMLRSAKAAYLAGQATEGIDPAGIYQRFRNIHAYIRRNGFPGDGDNNLVILDYDAPTEVNADNFAGHFVYGIESRHVESVICQGRVIVRQRKLTTVDESEILHFSREMGAKLWASMQKG